MSLEQAIDEAVRIALERHLPPLIQKYQPVPGPVEDERVTTERAAKILGISPTTMAIWRHKKTGPGWEKIGGRIVRYRRSVLEAYARENCGQLGKKGRPRKAR